MRRKEEPVQGRSFSSVASSHYSPLPPCSYYQIYTNTYWCKYYPITPHFHLAPTTKYIQIYIGAIITPHFHLASCNKYMQIYIYWCKYPSNILPLLPTYTLLLKTNIYKFKLMQISLECPPITPNFHLAPTNKYIQIYLCKYPLITLHFHLASTTKDVQIYTGANILEISSYLSPLPPCFL